MATHVGKVCSRGERFKPVHAGRLASVYTDANCHTGHKGENVMGKRRALIILVLALAWISWVAMGHEGEREEPDRPVIAVSMIGETHKWPVGVRYYAEQEVKRVAGENGWDYEFVVGNTANEQSDQIIQLIDQGVDCIVMLPMDGASLKTAAMSVQDAGIPLVIFDREIPDFAPTATVKGDNTEIGKMTADIFNGMFPDGTKVLEIMGDTSTVPQQRTDGFNEVLRGNFEKEQLGFTGWQRANARRIFEEWVAEHTQEEIDEVGAIFTHDDEIALGVLDALDAYGEVPGAHKTFDNLKVIAGSAGAKEMYERIMAEERYTLFSLTYSAAMIEKAIRVGESIIKEEDYEEMTIIRTVEVNKANVADYYDEDAPY